MTQTLPRPQTKAATPDAAPAAALEAQDVQLAYDGSVIIDGINVTIPRGQVTVLVGPNGCGKSTLLRGLARLLKPQRGDVILDGQRISHLPTKEIAKKLGVLPQSPIAPEGITVRELVAQGRYPHQSFWQQWSKQDEAALAWALETTRTTELAERPVDSLSGGQRQRVWIAMTLAQQTPMLLLDEPTTYLDMAHQVEVLTLLDELNMREGRTIVMVLHDINQACRYAHHLIALRDGKVVAEGKPTEVITHDLIRDVFGLACNIVPDPVTQTPLCVPQCCPLRLSQRHNKPAAP